ncbi:IS3 family transposase [Enterococcus faecalis]|uniref:IS3 family transposase n=1 Tax=Enterococcus faecalis TaxID=1351 RepID=UPI003CC594BC
MCTVLEVPKSSYYDWVKRKPFKCQSGNEYFSRLISRIYFENKEIYGAPKIYKIRIGRGEASSLKRVQKLMWELGLRSITMKKYKTDKQANVGP